ncbi:MAG: helix-turn-helix domain-containing protein [Parvibaculaceae bacterium]
MPAFDPVTALTRGLEVLRQINQLERATVTEIHKRTGYPKPTVLRMIETLINAGYVMREQGSATYAPTGKCLLLSNGMHAQARVTSVAAPFLSTFRRKVGWPSDFGLFDGDAMVIAATNREFGVLSLNRKVGARTPMLLSALGLAYLSFCGDEEADRILSVLRASGNPLDARANDPARAKRLLADTRKRGYSLTDDAYLETVYDSAIWGIGVPVLANGRVMASLNVMFLRSALSLDAGLDTLLPPLRETAISIGDALAKDVS